jgi:hypothetical protein
MDKKRSSRRAKVIILRLLVVMLTTGIGVITNFITSHWQLGLGIGLGVLVVALAAVEVTDRLTEEAAVEDVKGLRKVEASGPGAVSVGGNNTGTINTQTLNLRSGTDASSQ